MPKCKSVLNRKYSADADLNKTLSYKNERSHWIECFLHRLFNVLLHRQKKASSLCLSTRCKESDMFISMYQMFSSHDKLTCIKMPTDITQRHTHTLHYNLTFGEIKSIGRSLDPRGRGTEWSWEARQKLTGSSTSGSSSHQSEFIIWHEIQVLLI